MKLTKTDLKAWRDSPRPTAVLLTLLLDYVGRKFIFNDYRDKLRFLLFIEDLKEQLKIPSDV